MAEGKIQGGQFIVPVIFIAGFIALSMWMVSMDRSSNADLMDKVQMAVVTEYFPNVIDNNVKKKGYESVSVGSVVLIIKGINVSYPIYVRSNRYKTGVLKVAFTLTDSDKIVKDGVSFYRFSHSPIGDSWEIRGRSTKSNYFFSLVF